MHVAKLVHAMRAMTLMYASAMARTHSWLLRCCCWWDGCRGAQDYYELGVILTRKKLYTQATKNLEKAKKVWDGEETELAQASAARRAMRAWACMPAYGT